MQIYDQKTNQVLIQFDTYIQNSYHNSNNVAYEPLENGTFSSDSKQNSPFILSVTGVRVINSNPNIFVETVNQTMQDLQELATSSTLVYVILQPMVNQSKNSGSEYYQYGSIYNNLTLMTIDFENNSDQLEFRPTMVFQQVRLTNTEYTNSQNTANPENSSTQNQGQKQPVPFSLSNFLLNNSALNQLF